MSFMQPQVYKTEYYAIEDRYGETHHIDADLVGSSPTIEDFHDYVRGVWNGEDNDEYYEDRPAHPKARWYRHLEAKATSLRKAKKYAKKAEALEELHGFDRVPIRLTPLTGWMAYMSAPGYMDRTDPTAYDSEEEALEALLDMYGNNDGGEKEDWEAGIEERLAELQAS